MIDIIEIGLRLLGVFYVFAGIVGMRTLAMDHLLDQMLSGVTLRPVPAAEHRRHWLLGGTVLVVGMGGMAMMVLNLWAVPLFLLGSASQAIYLLWARTGFQPETETDHQGRRQTINAALLYGLATAIVCLAAGSGLLRDWRDLWALLIPLAGLLLLALAGRQVFGVPRRADDHEWFPEPPEPEPVLPPRAVALWPQWGGAIVIDADSHAFVDYDLFVPPELSERIWLWGHAFHACDDHEVKAFWAQFSDRAHEAAHRAEGEAIVVELRAIFGDDEASGPTYPTDIRYGPLP